MRSSVRIEERERSHPVDFYQLSTNFHVRHEADLKEPERWARISRRSHGARSCAISSPIQRRFQDQRHLTSGLKTMFFVIVLSNLCENLMHGQQNPQQSTWQQVQNQTALARTIGRQRQS